MPTSLRLAFMGSDPIALPLLEWLAGEGSTFAQVIAVFTQPDRPVGRGQKVTANAIKMWAHAHELPVFQPEKLTEHVRLQLAALRSDAALVMAYGHILRDDFIATPRLGTLNLHASLLPNYRGASPIQTAIASGGRETGVSLMRIVRKLDAGPVADVESVPIEKLDTALEIEAKLADVCVPLLARTLPRLSDGSLVFVPQDESRATFSRRLVKEDGVLDFGASASVLAARINGLFPWPACSVEIGGQRVKLGLAEAEPDGSIACPVGTVLASDQEALRIATGAGVLRLLKLQRPGGRMLPAVEFLRGFSIPNATVIPAETMPPLVGRSPFQKRDTAQKQ